MRKPCHCGNPQYGFNCMCDWVELHPGQNSYSCEFCGLYDAAIPRCNKCQIVTTITIIDEVCEPMDNQTLEKLKQPLKNKPLLRKKP